MSIAAMGPLLGALSVAPLIVSQAGFSAPFIFLVCWIAMGAVAITIGRFSRLLPGAASIYLYVTHGLGERLGFLTAWLSFSYYIIFVPLLLTAIGLYGKAAAADVFSVSIDWWVWAIVGAGIVTTLAIVGISLSMRIDLALAIICDGFLLLVSLILIAKVIGDGHFTLSPLSPSHASGKFQGLSLAIVRRLWSHHATPCRAMLRPGPFDTSMRRRGSVSGQIVIQLLRSGRRCSYPDAGELVLTRARRR